MARENAQSVEDVVGVPGRITTINGRAKAFTMPDWGASSHMARLVLEVMKHDPERRSALNLRYNTVTIEICEKLGHFDDLQMLEEQLFVGVWNRP